MPKFEFVGPDPIDHFTLGRVAPGDVVELDALPAGPCWRAARRRRPEPEQHGSDTPQTSEEA